MIKRNFDLLEEFVDLVPHLGGGDVFGSGLGVVASGPLDARQLGVFAWGVHHEAHTSGQVGLGKGWATLGRSGLSTDTSGKDTESNDDGLGDQEDDEVGDVKGEHLWSGGSSCQEFHGGRNQGRKWIGGSWHFLCSAKERRKKIINNFFSNYLWSWMTMCYNQRCISVEARNKIKVRSLWKKNLFYFSCPVWENLKVEEGIRLMTEELTISYQFLLRVNQEERERESAWERGREGFNQSRVRVSVRGRVKCGRHSLFKKV